MRTLRVLSSTDLNVGRIHEVTRAREVTALVVFQPHHASSHEHFKNQAELTESGTKVLVFEIRF